MAAWSAIVLWPCSVLCQQADAPLSLAATAGTHVRPVTFGPDAIRSGQGAGELFGFDDPVPGGKRSEIGGAVGARLPLGTHGYVEGYVLEYAEDDLEHSFEVLRRATGYSAGARQVFRLGGRGLELALGLRMDSMPSDPFAGRGSRYEGRELEAGLGWTLPGSVGARAFYGYRSGTSDRFADNKERHRIRLEIGHNVSDWLRLRASFLSRIHDSSALPSERGRYLACIGFEAKY
ncbi:MAG TPA: hypothetical protein VEC57_17985 [Candidatus Limnocylindrales bacterium]|nr:hypothetical protein [Candidatus Limnocylindrales bacterium]